MACATLKRPLEWSDPSMSPPSAHNSGHKDSHHSRAAKRRCISSVITPQINKDVSHFGDVQPILSSGLHFIFITNSFNLLIFVKHMFLYFVYS